MGKFLAVILLLVLVVGGIGVASYNGLVSSDEGVSAKWAEIDNQYQRRAELVPQLVETVKGAADFEKSTITEVTEMRAKVGQVRLPEGGPQSQEQMDEFIKSQDALGQSLGRLLMVAENYPQLKATEAFRDLQAQLEGNENRIGVARRDYIDAVQKFNTGVRSFPKNLLASQFGFEAKPQMSFDEAVRDAPKIDFGSDR
ncbi:LemA family protein [Planctomycetes bacterium Poly30]|uniref:LemA family protein n=1 Tax=Saltatorellus ferox TaxID=2528018 RepID=A0A518EKC0_9BACT|nr:LemA family protein [Planctomycetes bacterium Poly30]